MATLLLTSTREVSTALAPKLEALGHTPLLMPLLEISYFDCPAHSAPPNAILITSRYALPAAEKYRDTPLYIVGQQTADIAIAKGHHVEQIATNIDYLKDKLPPNTLYLRGREVSQELEIPSQTCYGANIISAPNPLPAHDAILLLSARIAAKLPITPQLIFCLSERIKQALPSEMQAQAQVPDSPTEIALLEMIKYWSPQQ